MSQFVGFVCHCCCVVTTVVLSPYHLSSPLSYFLPLLLFFPLLLFSFISSLLPFFSPPSLSSLSLLPLSPPSPPILSLLSSIPLFSLPFPPHLLPPLLTLSFLSSPSSPSSPQFSSLFLPPLLTLSSLLPILSLSPLPKDQAAKEKAIAGLSSMSSAQIVSASILQNTASARMLGTPGITGNAVPMHTMLNSPGIEPGTSPLPATN